MQAIEDALVLTRCLVRQAADPEAALLDSERRRLPWASRMQDASRRNEGIFHLRPAALAWARDAATWALNRLRPTALASSLDWIFEHGALAEQTKDTGAG